MNTIGEKWKKIMAKETTSTFTVTVKHRGNKKEFLNLFRPKGGQIDLEWKLEKTETKDGETFARYTPEQKMVRLLLKKCCEAAGLKYMGYKRGWGIPGGYHIEYDYCSKHSNVTRYRIDLKGIRINLEFSNGLNNPGELMVYYTNDPKEINKKIGRLLSRVLVPNESLKVNMADPDIEQKLTDLFEKWGTKYSV